MRSNQRFIRYRAHNFFWRLYIFKCSPSATSCLMNYSKKLIRSSEVPRKPIWMRSIKTVKNILYSQKMAGYGLVSKKLWEHSIKDADWCFPTTGSQGETIVNVKKTYPKVTKRGDILKCKNLSSQLNIQKCVMLIKVVLRTVSHLVFNELFPKVN